MFLQDVRDNKTEAANAAPQALRLCQMVGSTASNFNTHMHRDSKTVTSSHSHAIAVVLPLLAADTVNCQHECVPYIHMVFRSDGLCQTQISQISMISLLTIKVFCSEVAEQPVIVPETPGLVAKLCQLETSTDFLYSGTFSLRLPAIRALHL